MESNVESDVKKCDFCGDENCSCEPEMICEDCHKIVPENRTHFCEEYIGSENYEILCRRCGKDVPSENRCDYCETSYCDDCLDIIEDHTFRHCDACGRTWCYIWSKYWDGYCQANDRSTTHCGECGN